MAVHNLFIRTERKGGEKRRGNLAQPRLRRERGKGGPLRCSPSSLLWIGGRKNWGDTCPFTASVGKKPARKKKGTAFLSQEKEGGKEKKRGDVVLYLNSTSSSRENLPILSYGRKKKKKKTAFSLPKTKRKDGTRSFLKGKEREEELVQCSLTLPAKAERNRSQKEKRPYDSTAKQKFGGKRGTSSFPRKKGGGKTVSGVS